MLGRVIKAGQRGGRAVSIDPRTAELAENLIAARAEAEGLRHRLRHDVVELAVEIARAIIGAAADAGAVRLDEIYNRCLDSAQSLTKATVFVHPQDRSASRIDQMAGTLGFSVGEDSRVGRGGCRICSGGVELDATIDTVLGTMKRVMKEGFHV